MELSPQNCDYMLSLLNGSHGSTPTPGLIRNVIEGLARLAHEERRTIDQALLAEAVRRQLQAHCPKPTDIVITTARYCRLPVAELRGPSRRADLVRARSLAMYLIRSLTGASLQETGRLLGNRDHTTVMHALRKIETLSQSDPETKQALAELVNSLSSKGTP